MKLFMVRYLFLHSIFYFMFYVYYQCLKQMHKCMFVDLSVQFIPELTVARIMLHRYCGTTLEVLQSYGLNFEYLVSYGDLVNLAKYLHCRFTWSSCYFIFLFKRRIEGKGSYS